MSDSLHTHRVPSATPVQASSTETLERLQPWVVGFALALLMLGAGHLFGDYGPRHAVLLLVGAGLGLVLYHARFGFTSAFRALIVTGDGRGLRAQMVMLTLATLLFAPILALSSHAGGAVAPLSLSVLAGAFIFGIGMQLGSG